MIYSMFHSKYTTPIILPFSCSAKGKKKIELHLKKSMWLTMKRSFAEATQEV